MTTRLKISILILAVCALAAQQTSTISGVSFPLLGPVGSAGSPTYSFSSNPTQGMYSADSNNLTFSVVGSTRLQMSANGTGAGPTIFNNGAVQARALISATDLGGGGAKFTLSGCTAGTTVGGPSAGQFASGTTGVCTVVITINGATGMTAPNGWSCHVNDLTTGIAGAQSASSATTATLKTTTTSGDTVSFACVGY